MQELDPKILGKIKKCLALSASDNPNEAATAMRQAHALMEKHGVTAEGIIMGDIGEAKIKSRTMARNKPEQWEAYLAATVGKAFGCSMMVGSYVPTATARIKTINDGSFIFVGLKGQAQVAHGSKRTWAKSPLCAAGKKGPPDLGMNLRLAGCIA